MFKYFLLVISIVFFNTQVSANIIACTQEAKMCSDWSYVSRIWPNCEFADCPNSNDLACTMEYAPICWKVQVQCIKAPCYPVLQTFWNKCTLSKNKSAVYLHDWECISDVTKNRTDFLIAKLMTKINQGWYDNNQKIEILNTLKMKIIAIKKEKPNLVWICIYIIDSIQREMDKIPWSINVM